MKRAFLCVVVVGLLSAVAVMSSNQALPLGSLFVKVEDRNPWTNLRINNQPENFQFVIVSDRTGGHRPAIFSRAVEQINLLQPEFVISVGDLIEGYTDDQKKLNTEWKEFQGFVCKLDMPFFYMAGNHDITNATMAKLWNEKFGRSYYHFVYHDVLFLMLNTEDPPGKGGMIGKEQLDYIAKALEANKKVRWTLVFLHRPMWDQNNGEKNGWADVEEVLAGRRYTVFAGHYHRYQRITRKGQTYFRFATTGGGSKVRGPRYGEFDHIVWVTMKNDGPVLANLMLDGIYPETMKMPVSDEPGHPRTKLKTYRVTGQVHFDGAPTPHAQVNFYLIDPKTKKMRRISDALVEPDGTFRLSTYGPFDGAPAGDYAVTVVMRRPLQDASGRPGPNLLPARYGRPDTSGLRAKIKSGANTIKLDLLREEKKTPIEE